MSGFDLPNNYIDNPEALLRKNRSRTACSTTLPAVKPVTPVPSATITMAKSLRDYSTPVGPAINTGTRNFKLQTGLITMVQASQFCGLPSKDASAHLQHFLELCNTIVIKDVAPASIRLRLFPFSNAGKAKQWFYQSKGAIDTWDKCSAAFLVKFFPMGKTSALRGKFPTSSKLHLNPSPRHRRGSKITSRPTRTMEWKNGLCSKTFARAYAHV
jgi:hypothetical protein